jgi:hypothetical protein
MFRSPMGWVWVCGNFFSTSDLHNLRRVEPQRFWGSMGFESEATERMEIPCKIPRGERCSLGVAFSPVETFSRDQQITSYISDSESYFLPRYIIHRCGPGRFAQAFV